ncbi:MAG: TerB family tellurite resistance protein [Saprospiraceae bacterium]|nr:TerB family tellurite resistance protein [Saprospiraceae bacterium]
MKPSKEKLYDALGELIYAVAKADGLVQESETSKLQEILQQHTWASQVQWSFEYEKTHETSLDDAYAKALDTCKEYGPAPEYAHLFDILYQIAQASNGLDAKEARVMVQLKLELTEHFMNLDL